MKRFLFSIAFLPCALLAQDLSAPAADKDKPALRHELGVNLFSVTDMTTSWGRYYINRPEYGLYVDFHPLTGIYYKLHSGKNVFRAALDYDQQVTFINTGDIQQPFYYKATGIGRTGGLRVGYEREFGNKRFLPFVSGDLAFAYSNYSGVQSWAGDFGSGENVAFTDHWKEYGISAGAGIKFKATDHLTLTLETTGQAFRSHYRREGSVYSGTEIAFRYNPVRTFGLSWTF